MVDYDAGFARPPHLGSPYWLIFSNTSTAAENTTNSISIAPGGVGDVLPVFGSEEQALYFMEGARDRGAEPFAEMLRRESAHLEVVCAGRARLARALHATLKDIDLVAFDPLPPPNFMETVRVASMSRGAFVDALLGRGKEWSQRRFGGQPRYRDKGAFRT